MPSTKKPRKAYKPKIVRRNNMDYLITGMKPLACIDDELVKLCIKNHAAFASLAQGKAGKTEFDILLTAFNMTEALMMQKLGDGYHGVITEGQQAMYAIGVRSLRLGGKFIAKSEELRALNKAMELHDAQLEICTVAELEKAIFTVASTISKGKTIKIPVLKNDPTSKTENIRTDRNAADEQNRCSETGVLQSSDSAKSIAAVA